MSTKVFGKRPRLEALPARHRESGKWTDATVRMMTWRAPRRETWAACTLFSSDGTMRAVCVEVSASGARIRLGEGIMPPARARFVSAQLGLNREAMLSRIDGLEAAYRFTD